MKTGCYTAMISPFTEKNTVDYDGLDQLADFQIKNGITGMLAVGTTGESPTLAWEEHNKVIARIAAKSKNKCICIAGTGSNNTQEALNATKHAVDADVDAVLLVDPYYNGPSSTEIRKEYIGPVAEAFPQTDIIPYIIPGRTGAQLLAQDLATLAQDYKNVNSVKEATGDLDNMRKTRALCGDQFNIFSGDDSLVYDMMTDEKINASGVISVAANIIPGFMSELTALLAEKKTDEAKKIMAKIKPLFDITTIITTEQTFFGDVQCRARNPLAVKTLMALIGMPSGFCRRPLGKMTANGLNKVIAIAKLVQSTSPEVFEPVADFFNIDIEARLNNKEIIKSLCY